MNFNSSARFNRKAFNSDKYFDAGIHDAGTVVEVVGGVLTEYVENGTFETGDFTGWTDDESTSGTATSDVSVQSGVIHAGTYAAMIDLAADGYPSKASGSFRQDIDLTVVDELSFYINVTNYADGGDGTFFVVDIDGTEEYRKEAVTVGWVLVQIDTTSYSGVCDVNFHATAANWEA